ncbi:MAG: hypothetical protein Q8928_06990 [Bacteroidota bacterium]|nr:hypothetical protein [Bacteroidota bacterium]
MKGKLLFLILVFVCSYTSTIAQKSKGSTQKSHAEKMGYARTNKYWGPGTYYAFAPGTPRVKMVNNQETAMRDLTGIAQDDCITELGKQGFVAIAPKETEKWYNENKSKDKKFYYSSDKSYILWPHIADLYMSSKNGYTPYAVTGVARYVLVPREDTVKVREMIWQYLRDLNDLKVILSSFTSTFKKADPKAYPIEQAGASGWTSMRAGSFLLRMVNGKPSGVWARNEDIVRRTIAKPEFQLRVLGMETDFWYGLTVKLMKEGYVFYYEVLASTMNTLEPGSNWTAKHKEMVMVFNTGEKMDKDAVAQYKKAPLPPVLEDLDKLLHIKM